MGACGLNRLSSKKCIKSTSLKIHTVSSNKHSSPEKKQILSEVYEIISVLKTGRFGIVYKATHKSNANLTVAIKSILKSDKIFSHQSLQHEISILKLIDHPNIVKFYDFFEESDKIHIVMEYCSGGELFERITEKGSICEKDAAKYLHKILGAVNYLHSLGVCHRDIKPQNLLFENESEDAELKLIDFGLSNNLEEESQGWERMNTFVGTPYYIAPEILKGNYDIKCDLWSFGVTMFVMLTGEFPFNGSTPNEIYGKIEKQNIEIDAKKFQGLSENAVDLMKKLLIKNPEFRISAKEAIVHKWFFEAPDDEINGQNIVIDLLKNYTQPYKTHKAAIGILVKYLTVEKLKKLREIFFAMDCEKNGFLTAETIERVINESRVKISRKQKSKVFKNLMQSDGKICYTEFIAAVISENKEFDEQQLFDAFRMLDKDNMGFITPECLYDAYEQLGKPLANFKLDKSYEEKINFETFKKIVSHNRD